MILSKEIVRVIDGSSAERHVLWSDVGGFIRIVDEAERLGLVYSGFAGDEFRYGFKRKL